MDEEQSYLDRLSSMDLYKTLEEKRLALGQKRADLLTKMNQEQALTPQQATMSGLASIIPMLAGLAIAGKRGGIAGAEVGLQTGGSMMDKYGKQQEKESALAKAQYDLYGDQEKELSTLQRDYQKAAYGADINTERDESRELMKRETNRLDPRGTKITVNNDTTPEGYSPPAELTKEARGRASMQQRLSSLVESFNTDPELNKLLGEAPATRPDGSVDIGAGVDLLIRGLTEKSGIAANTLSAEKKAQVGQLLSEYLKSISGAAVSDPEYQRVARNMTGDGALIPANWAASIDYLTRFAEQDRQGTLTELATDYRLGNGIAAGSPEDIAYRQRLETILPPISRMKGPMRPRAANAVEGTKDAIPVIFRQAEEAGNRIVEKFRDGAGNKVAKFADGTFRREDGTLVDDQGVPIQGGSSGR